MRRRGDWRLGVEKILEKKGLTQTGLRKTKEHELSFSLDISKLSSLNWIESKATLSSVYANVSFPLFSILLFKKFLNVYIFSFDFLLGLNVPVPLPFPLYKLLETLLYRGRPHKEFAYLCNVVKKQTLFKGGVQMNSLLNQIYQKDLTQKFPSVLEALHLYLGLNCR